MNSGFHLEVAMCGSLRARSKPGEAHEILLREILMLGKKILGLGEKILMLSTLVFLLTFCYDSIYTLQLHKLSKETRFIL